MGRGKRLEIGLSAKDRQQIEQLLGGGGAIGTHGIRALALLQMDQGQSTPAVGANLMLSAKAVWQIDKRYQQGGIERALFDAARPNKAPALNQQLQQLIVAVVCSPPPKKRARWTVRLLTEEVVKRKLVPKVGRETICVLLESHDLKPWRGKMWCVAKVDEEYIAKMEDVLKIYEKPLTKSEPVVCVDEKHA